MIIKLKFDEIRELLNIESPDFPKYVAPLINLANQYAQGTRPQVVGQMSELIKEFKGKTLKEWGDWYIKNNPDAIKNATEKIMAKLDEIRNAFNQIDRQTVEKWVKDLVIVKTFIGLKFHEAILKKGAEIKGCDYKLSTPEEESKGIDGYICNIPVSIKPHTYKTKALPEQIDVRFIYYKKVKDGIEADYSEILK